jgi:hypothetical protein
LQPHLEAVRQVAATLEPTTGPLAQRQATFETLTAQLQRSRDPIHQTMARTMQSFAPGLFAGGDDPELPRDNLDLERFFRVPKGHERHIHGHRHAGVRIVIEGPSLLPALDAHLREARPLSCAELLPYADAPMPTTQQAALQRRRVMRQARSTRQRPVLLKSLEELYRNTS